MRKPDPVQIKSHDYWFKVVEMLQQNWALMDHAPSGGFIVYFVHDRSGVFDRLSFSSPEIAEQALRRNGFSRFSEDESAKDFLIPPEGPFFESPHPNGPIYSSGRLWRL